MQRFIFDRKKKNIFGAWWWTIDRFTLLAIFAIITIGAIMVAAASPAVAERIGLPTFYFVQRQMVFLALAVVIMFSVSNLSARSVRRLGAIGFCLGIILLVVVLLGGAEAKGAKRWLYIFGFSLQPSEFMKPLFIVVTAWLLSESGLHKKSKGFKISVILYLLLVALLMAQPDLGMTVTISAVWAGQLFLAGLSLNWIVIIAALGCVGILGAYTFFPHVAYRIQSFLASFDGGGNFQVKKSLEAFHHGGFLGTGPGEGSVKQHLPDSHTDFIFAVVGEELGAIVCIVIVILYGYILIRGFRRMLSETDLFTVYAVSGLLMQFGMQAVINMGVALNLLPTKGMTLPFISYGGSSMLAIALAMGMMLALTRKRFGAIAYQPKLVMEVP